MIGIGVVGYGYWGPNLVRNFYEIRESQVIAVSDLSLDRLQKVQARYPTVSVTQNYQELLNNPHIEAIAIATPVSAHFDLALQA
jgi:predicted dehydrogenase